MLSEDLPQNLLEVESFARRRLDQAAYDYFRSGAWDESTLRRNRRAYREIDLLPRVLVGVAKRDPSVMLLGRRAALPIIAAPTAFHRLAHPGGEVATARAFAAAGAVMVLSSLSTTPVEEVAAQGGEVWFQLYAHRDHGRTRALVDRVVQAGCRALMLTADTPVWGVRERDVRNRFHLPPGLSAVNLVAIAPEGEALGQRGAGMGEAFDWMLNPGLCWRDLERICSDAPVPVLLKGLCRAEDARRALEAGCAGVVVSNHGGRQLDGQPATIEVLPEIVAAVEGRGSVLVDGGVRRGTDILKALALGADAVQIGRPVLWALACDGEAGVRRMLGQLARELDLAMALAGCPDRASIARDLVRLPREWKR
jgi:4-hydroxymandelate oxidase